MSMATQMDVSVRLPARRLFDGAAVAVNGVGRQGAFGLLPNHVDTVVALVPSVMALRLVDGTELFFGLDEGILVKRGHRVDIACIRGIRGTDLGALQESVEASFVQIDEEERLARSALARLEADMVRRFAELREPVQ
ncbi:ATPase [Tropicimonas sp. TH_r6]|uniref:ATPase n=1 Tax=Tropicimonas sp. TH_r6 TaxID=3082085 RepID=UPI002954923D|nr:ATPase [Tropicimonas sp. TH_r6]MDV7143249.1 ATPase [Tropicimonas sp. TH_r6]